MHAALCSVIELEKCQAHSLLTISLFNVGCYSAFPDATEPLPSLIFLYQFLPLAYVQALCPVIVLLCLTRYYRAACRSSGVVPSQAKQRNNFSYSTAENIGLWEFCLFPFMNLRSTAHWSWDNAATSQSRSQSKLGESPWWNSTRSEPRRISCVFESGQGSMPYIELASETPIRCTVLFSNSEYCQT